MGCSKNRRQRHTRLPSRSYLGVSSGPPFPPATKRELAAAAPNLVAAFGTAAAAAAADGTTKGRGDTGSATHRAPNARH